MNAKTATCLLALLLAATGGSERHALVIDHQLRPLFSFFQAQTLPVGVYATDADFTDYRISSPAALAVINTLYQQFCGGAQ